MRRGIHGVRISKTRQRQQECECGDEKCTQLTYIIAIPAAEPRPHTSRRISSTNDLCRLHISITPYGDCLTIVTADSWNFLREYPNSGAPLTSGVNCSMGTRGRGPLVGSGALTRC